VVVEAARVELAHQGSRALNGKPLAAPTIGGTSNAKKRQTLLPALSGWWRGWQECIASPAFDLSKVLMLEAKQSEVPGSTITNPSWDGFTDATRQIVSVPHDEIKAHLDAEKKAKRLKRMRKSKHAAFRKVNATTNR